MKRRIVLTALACIMACLMLATCVSANFEKTLTYADGTFTDVSSSDWFASYVKDAYEFGIMNGNSATTFNPNGTLTVAEGITIASRIYETLNAKPNTEQNGVNWYDKYVQYAISNGFMTADQFDNYDRKIKRYEIAELLADVCGELSVINTVEKVPDIPSELPFAEKVLKLYKAGILTGNDDYGTFAAQSNLLRSEISAMAVRIADSSKRVSKTFKTEEFRTYSDAYYIFDSVARHAGYGGIAHAWKYDNRFDLDNPDGSSPYAKTDLVDGSSEQFFRLIRDFDPENDGVLDLTTIFAGAGSDECAYIGFFNEDDELLFRLTPRNGKWVFIGETELVTPIDAYPAKAPNRTLKLHIDLDRDYAEVVIDNVFCGYAAIPDDAPARLVFGTEKEGTGSITFLNASMTKNYVLNENADELYSTRDYIPYDWEMTGDFATELINSNPHDMNDQTSILAESKAGAVSKANKTFTPVTGLINFETLVLLPEKTDGASVALLSNGAEVIKIETKDGGKFYIGDTFIHDYIANVWQELHFDINTDTGIAEVFVNGKKRADIAITAKTIDEVEIKFAPNKDAVMWFDDVELYTMHEYADYPSYPQVASSDDYNVGINVCWLWRDSLTWEGWDAAASFPELTPYIGFFDEGLREAADWELKWMAEHGIDFIHACWYAPSEDVKAPIKETKSSHYALHDGYMFAKYSNLVDFCIMWENSRVNVNSFEQFRDYIWNYWVEYYFTDPRYARLDNKAVLTVYGNAINNFESTFGGAAGARKAVEFMEQELIKLGYDGLIFLTSVHESTSATKYTRLANLGIDGTYAYSWHTAGSDADYQILCNDTCISSAEGILHHIPTVSMGFNEVARHNRRYPLVSVEGHLKVCEYIKQKLSTFKTGTWKDNTVFLSTWNEFTEGTYMFPTEGIGFNYLENVRKVFTNDTSDHTLLDTKPTWNQIDRVTHMFPSGHSVIRQLQLEETDLLADELGQITATAIPHLVPVYSFDMSKDGAAYWDNYFSLDTYSEEGGVISGSSSLGDFAIRTNKEIMLDTSKATVAHVRLKASGTGSYQLYYATDTGVSYSAGSLISSAITETGKFVDYYVDLSSRETWTGNITSLRFDPMTTPGSFELALVEFMTYDEEYLASIPVITVNGRELEFAFMPKILPDGDFEVTAQAKFTGFFSNLRLYHEWDRFSGTLKVFTGDEKELVFTVGSDKVVVDGVAKDLGYTFRTRDGLPVFHMKKLCDLVGYTYETPAANVMIVEILSDSEIAILEAREENRFDFEFPGDTEGWGVYFSVDGLTTQNGKLVGTPSGRDFAIRKDVSFNSYECEAFEFKVRYTEAMKTNPAMLFFATEEQPGFSGSRRFTGNYDIPENVTTDDFITVRIETNSDVNPNWNGKITQFRFDLWDAMDPFEIEYIHFDMKPINTLEWEFKESGDDEGWIMNSCDGFVSGGVLGASPLEAGANISKKVNFTSDAYTTFIAGVKYTGLMMREPAKLYFKTAEDKDFTVEKCLTANYSVPFGATANSVVEVYFDLQNPLFAGEITELKFVPFESEQYFEIDYLKTINVELSGTGTDIASVLSGEPAVSWEFEKDGDLEGWKFQSAAGSVSRGSMSARPENADPSIIRDVSIDPSKCLALTVGIQYNSAVDKYTPRLFYATEDSENFTADKSFSGSYIASRDEEGVMEAYFDLTSASSSEWAGRLTKLRFDPYDDTTQFQIEYIRIYGEGDITLPEPEPEYVGPYIDRTGGEVDTTAAIAWEFNENGNTGGWGFMTCDPASTAVDGYFVVTPKGKDPAITREVSFDASACEKITIGVRYKKVMLKHSPMLFFTTDEYAGYSAERMFTGSFEIADTIIAGDTVEVTFNVASNSSWLGTITGLRFDPFDDDDVFEINYIRLYAAEGKTLVDGTEAQKAEKLASFTEEAAALKWEFDSELNEDEWGFASCEGAVSDGVLSLVPDVADPSINWKTELAASECKTLVVGMKYNTTMLAFSPALFFANEDNDGFAGSRRITGEYIIPAGTKEGDIIMAVFELDHSEWIGNITNLRFDPYDATTPFDIDYIRIYK